MMWFQELAREHTKKPVFTSSLIQLSAAKTEDVGIFTANSTTLTRMNGLIEDQCGVNPDNTRFDIIGCQDAAGFEAVAVGGKVDVQKVTPGIVALALQAIKKNPNIRVLLLECTELPPYADALRHATGLPVYDAIACANMFIEGLVDNPRFGLHDWQEECDGLQDEYYLGANLDEHSYALLSVESGKGIQEWLV